MLYVVGGLLVYVLLAQATPKLKPLTGDVEHVSVAEIQTGRIRVQRSVNEDCHFPSTLSFQFRIKGVKILLNLEKNVYLSRRVPLYVTTNIRTHKEKTSNENKFAVYQDVIRGSAMLVSCQDDGSFRLHGSFRHDGEMYHMSHSNVPVPSPVHYIQRDQDKPDQNFNDFLVPPTSIKDELQNSRNSSRQKRADIPGGYIVELLFTVDKAFYQYFLSDQESDAAARLAIEQYAALLANEMDLYFCSVDMVDPSLTIKIYLVGVEIPEVGNDVSWSTSSQAVADGVTYIDVNSVLPNIRSWLIGESNLPQHDHLMALSKLDLAVISSGVAYTGVEGYAYVGSVCSSEYKVSFTEVDGSRVSKTAAHELGHGLNAVHDGEGEAVGCSANVLNIMTPNSTATTTLTFAEAQWTFSSCSVASFKSFIESLDFNCLKDHAFTAEEFEALQAKSLPGIVYPLDQQCQMFNGLWSTSCDATLSESDCYGGYHCSTSATPQTGCNTAYYPLYPLAGTPCGAPEDNKWCFRGLCVARTIETPTTAKTTTSTTTSTTTTSPRTSTTSTRSSTPSTTICPTSSLSTSTVTFSTSTTTSTSQSTSSSTSTLPTTSTPTTTSTTSPTTTSTTTPTTTSTTSPTTTSTTSSTTSTMSPTTTSTTQPTTTSSTTSTSTTSPTTTSSTTSTATTSPTTSTTSTSPTTTSTTSTSSPTTSTTSRTTTTTPAPCERRKRCCVRVNRQRKCCRGLNCCTTSNNWFVNTDCYNSCCSSTGTTLATESPFCSQECCVRRRRRTKCCTGRACCNVPFGRRLDCCQFCN